MLKRFSNSHVTEIRDGSRQTPKDTVYAYDSFGRRILEADILNRWVRHTEYRGLSMDVLNGASKNVSFFEATSKMRCPKPRYHSGLGLVGISKNRQRRVFRDCPKNAAVHGIKEPRDSRGIDSTGMVFKGLNDFLPAFADFSRASPYDFTHVALTLPLGMGGEVFGLLQTEHSGIGFNPFVNASHTDAERHYFGKDHLGSVRAVTNQWGSPLYMFDYDVFGQPLQDRPERYRLGFTGKEYDSWTGLYNYGFRDYSAMFGRFTSVDPIQDGHNWYAYVNSDPVSWLDPWGLECPDQESGADKKKEDTGRVINKTGDIILIKPELDENPYTLLKPGETYEGNIDGVIFADGTVFKTEGSSKYVAKQKRSGEYKVSGGKIKDFFGNIVKINRNNVYAELISQGYKPEEMDIQWKDFYGTYHYGIDKDDFLTSWLKAEKMLDVDNDKDHTADTSFVPIPFTSTDSEILKRFVLKLWKMESLYEAQ